ncbi:hypothetical protein BGZ59_002703 [Podila verticillata]|nr:hypothetical protein BGZ59_002703 [Podila verticillata]
MIKEADRIIDLNGEWKLSNKDNTIRTTANVPGQVHLDLIEAGILEDDLYFGTNYVKYTESSRAIIHDTWTLEREFEIQGQNFDFAVLDCEGLDTFATVFVNDIEIAQTENQFRRYLLDVANAVKHGQNTIRIRFEDATQMAKDKAEKYPYYVPDMFNMSDAQHGFPRRNMIRKEQCSFSWDWGPAFAPCGIWRPISLRLDKDGLLISKWWGSSFHEDKKLWSIEINIETRSTHKQYLLVAVEIKNGKDQTPSDSALAHTTKTLTVESGTNLVTVKLEISDDRVQRWWPRGFGAQHLYEVVATVSAMRDYGKTPIVVGLRSFWLGFRTCSLVQEPVGEKGATFHFEVNDVPIFAKGTNWIPGHVFDRLMTTDNKRYLLESCAQANMNMIRVWGGGRYETEEFYSLCDRLGIMVWQEFMFACALCPVDKPFLENVELEVTDQVSRLMCHSSIVLWSGNNENQEFMVKGYVLEDSERGLYGDIHFYDYKHNGLLAEHYPNSRFVSEVAPSREWHPRSALMVHRNHHGNGQQEMIQQIELQFELPPALSKYYHADPSLSLALPEKNRGALMDGFCYLTQCAQARSITAQTEHYRRGNGLPIHTMGALYWQLNDIWPGPTWSSIENNGNWKPLHYFMRNAFQDIVVTGFQPPKSQDVHIHVSVCSPEAVSGSLGYRTLHVASGELSDFNRVPFSIPGQGSKQVVVIPELRSVGGKDPSFVIFAEAELDAVSGANGPSIARMLPQIYPVERPFPLSLLEQDPALVVEDFVLTEKDLHAYEIQFTMTATAATAGFVVLRWIAHVQGWFSDNGFWLLKGEPKKILFSGRKNHVHDMPALTTDDLVLLSLSTVVRDADLARTADNP